MRAVELEQGLPEVFNSFQCCQTRRATMGTILDFSPVQDHQDAKFLKNLSKNDGGCLNPHVQKMFTSSLNPAFSKEKENRPPSL